MRVGHKIFGMFILMPFLLSSSAIAGNFQSCPERSWSDTGKLVTSFAPDPTRPHCCVGTSECRWKDTKRLFVSGSYCSIKRTPLDCSRVVPLNEDSLDFKHDGEYLFLNPTDLSMRSELTPLNIDRQKILADLQIDAPTSIIISAHVSTGDVYVRSGTTAATMATGTLEDTRIRPYRLRVMPEKSYRIHGTIENCTLDQQRIFVTQNGASLNGTDCVIVKKDAVDFFCTQKKGVVDGILLALESIGYCGQMK